MKNKFKILDEVKEELHARPYIKLVSNLRTFHFAYLIKDDQESLAWKYLNKFLTHLNFKSLPEKKLKFWIAEGKDLIIRYECHTEFISLTLIYPDKVESIVKKKKPKLFDEKSLNTLPLNFLIKFPGQLIFSTWIEMYPGNSKINPLEIENVFFHDNFAGSEVAEKGAKIFMSFKSDRTNYFNTGFRRVFIQNVSLRSRRTGRLLQRIVELETYQVLSLIGLPKVRDESKNLSKLEKEISNITRSVSELSKEKLTNSLISYPDFQKNLNQLSYVVAQIENISSSINYRISATFAYYKLVEQRLSDLRETRLESFQTCKEFLNRRLEPAIRTCEAFSKRLESLATRAQRADNLVRTQIEMGIQLQNKDLLMSMEKRASAQLRLQEAVETLSLVAITYYLIGLISSIIKPINFDSFFFSKEIFISISIPIIFLTIWFIAKILRKKIKK